VVLQHPPILIRLFPEASEPIAKLLRAETEADEALGALPFLGRLQSADFVAVGAG